MINIEILDKDVVELEVPGKAALIKRAEWGHIVGDISNQEDLQAELDLKAKEIDLENHTNNKENPHKVTKAQVGLGNVDNTSDIDKPISTAAQAALDEKISDVKVNSQSVVTDMVANITVPTTTNELTNNSGFITRSVDDLDNYTTTASLKDALELKANVSRVEVVENDINSLGSNINTLNDSVTELQSSVDSLENDINSLYNKKEDITNKVTTLSVQSTDTQYPSAKVVYDDAVAPIATINSKIPSQASSSNKLADKNFVNSSIATNTAYFKGTYDVVSDLGLTVSATHEQVAVALGTTITGATNNDYCFVSIPSTTQVGNVDEYDRYKYDGTSWLFEYSLNNSSFTAEQWTAINSGITSTLVEQITINENNIALKADTDDIKDGILTISENGTILNTFSANESSNKNIDIEAPTNLKNGANNSIHQINATNIGPNSVALGTSISGSKAFSVSQLSNDKKTFTFTSIIGLEVGLIGNVYINDGTTDTNYMMFASIESINGNNVTFDNAIAWDGDLNLQNSYIWFIGHPELGDISIGNGAIAEGFNTNATQIGSHSEGIGTVALGKYSHAEGNGSIAGGYCSTAIGRDTQTKGMYAFASGRASEGNGDYSFAGIQGKANGSNSVAIGTSVEANGNYSVAMGHGSKANGEESVAIGQNNTSNNKYAVTMGFNNLATGNGAAALNKNNTSSGEGSLAVGLVTTASGYASTSLGTGTTASGGRSVAFGYNTTASAPTSVAGGATSLAQHESSIAFGTRCATSRKEQVVIGRDNANNSNALFIIGDGTNENNKHNAFEVLADDVKSNGVSLERTSNKVTSIDSESTDTQYPSAKCVYDDAVAPIATINSKIPSQATSENQLADKNFVNSSIATNTAYFKGTYDIVDDLHLTTSATHSEVAVALATIISSPTNNDYCFVSIPSSQQTGDVDEYDRYKFNGTEWEFEFSLNNSSFTAEQWAAINSGITASDVTKLAGIEAGAQVNTIDDVKVNNVSVISSGVANIPVASSKGLGVVSGNTYYGFSVDQRDGSKGNVSCSQFRYTNYQNASNAIFISKGTLENVITGKGLATTSQIPTNVSQLNNDSGYLTLGTLPIYNGGVI